jgi:type IV pilus biogenesis protein PilP
MNNALTRLILCCILPVSVTGYAQTAAADGMPPEYDSYYDPAQARADSGEAPTAGLYTETDNGTVRGGRLGADEPVDRSRLSGNGQSYGQPPTAEQRTAGERLVTETETTTRTTTTSVVPPPPKVERPCERTASCGKAETMRLHASMGERRALLKAEAEVLRLQKEKNKLECDLKNDCAGQSPQDLAAAQALAAQSQQSQERSAGVYYVSIFGAQGDARAELLINGVRTPVRVGDRLEDGSRVHSIDSSGVQVEQGGQRRALPSLAVLREQMMRSSGGQ